MPSGVYLRTLEMKTGKFERTDKHKKILSENAKHNKGRKKRKRKDYNEFYKKNAER